MVVFLGWQQPFAAAVAQYLIERHPEMHFAGTTVVVSGGRAGRRILTLLADEAQRRRLPMVPPSFVTAGDLPELLYRPPCPPAETFLRQVAWLGALRRAQREVIQPLFPRLADGDDLTTWQGAAGVLDRCKDELAAAGTDFQTILSNEHLHNALGDVERWQSAAALHAAYLDQLAAMGLCDRQQARAAAAATGDVQAPGPIILAGVPQLSRQTHALLNHVADAVEVLIYAPEDLADGFDHFGSVRPEFWCARHVDLAQANLRSAQTISDQADAVFAEIAAVGPAVPADAVTIGVADEAIVPYLQTTADNLAAVAIRYGGGSPLAASRPFQLLKVIADYLETRDFKHYSILTRHPDLERWLRAYGSDDLFTPRWRDWKSLLDEYAADYLPARLGPACNQPEGWRTMPSAENDDRPDLAWLYSRIDEFLGPLHTQSSQTPDAWATPILEVLHRAYALAWDQTDEPQRRIVAACQALREVLGELHDTATIVDRSHFPRVAAHEAIRGVLALVAPRRIPPPPQTGAQIEVVGWLELMADDAPHLIVTGFNEGLIPEAAGPDPLINDKVREAAGLLRDRDRLARDAYLLTAMLRSRPAGAVTLIAGRLSPQGDPLLPSRLTFACDDRTAAERVLKAVAPPPPAPPLRLRFAPGLTGGFRIGAEIPPDLTPITSMRVTAFRDYLASPQGFYLRHVLGLATLDDVAPREMDARECGDLVHKVMKAFAATPAAATGGKQRCIDELIHLFNDLLTQRFGGEPQGTLKFQAELIRRRLAIVGERQAEWFDDGWRIRYVEWTPPDPAEMIVDGAAMGLRGRIDRIDYHEATNTWALLDYKVGNGERTPEKTHLRAGQWCDLQLPLYRYLAAGIVGEQELKFGYVAVSDRADCTRLALADWDAAALAAADQVAHRVIRDVRQGRFDDVGDHPPTDGIFAYVFGQGTLAPDADEDEDLVEDASP
jgi:RecB family exonuclease